MYSPFYAGSHDLIAPVIRSEPDHLLLLESCIQILHVPVSCRMLPCAVYGMLKLWEALLNSDHRSTVIGWRKMAVVANAAHDELLHPAGYVAHDCFAVGSHRNCYQA